MAAGRIAIVTDDPGWHGRELRAALAARGFDSSYASLTEAELDLDAAGPPIRLPGFDTDPPSGVFVRGVPGGTLEQVILRLDVLHALRELGIVVYNDARPIERTVDKAMTSLLLKRAGIPSPATWVCESGERARAVVVRETAGGGRLVAKPLFGSQGLGLARIDDPADLGRLEDFRGVYYLQRFIDRPAGDWHDWRVLVINGMARAAMVRRSGHWITNRAQGGSCEPASVDGRLGELAEQAVRAVGIDYAGVDLIADERGELLVTEVNSIPAWRGLQSVCGIHIAGALIDHFIARLAANASIEALP